MHDDDQADDVANGDISDRSGADLFGLILAGGQGRRCGGRDKAWLRFRGKPLLCHAVERLQPQVDRLLISANRHRWAYDRLGLTTVADAPVWAQRGPLAAIASAFARHPKSRLVITPVDCPGAPRDHVQRLMAAVDAGAPAAALHDGVRPQPLFAVLSATVQPAAVAALISDRPPSMRDWLRAQGVCWVDYPDPDGSVFANINRMDDLQRLEAECAHG